MGFSVFLIRAKIHSTTNHATVGSRFCVLIGNKAKKEKYGEKKMSVRFINGLIIPSHGRGGGLAFFWKKEITVDV